MSDRAGTFYLGKTYDPQQDKITDNGLLYEADDLTTHAVAVGMTGSGKTGLCIDLLEEAALNDIPALMIDPKGDMTNTLLHFPELQGEDFLPWINPDQARREEKTREEFAAEEASTWKNGLEKWGIIPERIQDLSQAAQFTVYTPGSEAGVPINILSSFVHPQLPWEEHREDLREKISGIVSGILGLVGMKDLDPVRSEEHILISNIFEHAWKAGRDLDLGELILQIQNPPFNKLGMIDLEQFLPEKERLELSMMLNNILAAPSFQSWITGTPLDVEALLYTPDGQVRHSVFYIAHLSEPERMFFVTLLYAAVETWMRKQKGSPSLRAIVYFDEIFGYLPPVKNPPSKTPMLRMLKQARAFGVGQVLVTQNPVDVDYKALSNAGTWFIGKLQTEQDKERLLEGLEGASPGIERKTYDRLISTLDKRVFLLHNVHEDQPQVFHTRWAMNYLTGPLTRTQIPALNKLAGIQEPWTEAAPVPGGESTQKSKEAAGSREPERRIDGTELPGTATAPHVPDGIDEYFYPQQWTLQEAAGSASISPGSILRHVLLYRPVLVSQANVRFLKRGVNLDYEMFQTAVVKDPDPKGRIEWENWTADSLDRSELRRKGDEKARFGALYPPLNDGGTLDDLEDDFKDWIYHHLTVTVRGVEELDVFAGPQIGEDEFQNMLEEAVKEGKAEEIEEVNASYQKKIEGIKDRLIKEERELEEDEMELSSRRLEEMGKHVENVLSLLSGRKRSLTTSLTKRRMTSKAKSDVQESLAEIEEYQEEIKSLEEERQQELRDVEEKWAELRKDVEEIPVTPYKKDILIDVFGVVWFPCYMMEVEGRWVEAAAYPGL